MAWAFSVVFDDDKPNVGTVTATFTDTDLTVFAFSERLQATAGVVSTFTTAAIAARNTWQTLKTHEANAVGSLKTAFTAAGEAVS